MTRPSRIAAAVFDYDGVISDTERPKCIYTQRQLALNGVSLSDEEAFSLCGGDDTKTVPVLLARHGSSMTFDEFLSITADIDSVYAKGDIEPSPGIVAFIRQLRERGVRIGIASSTRTEHLLVANERMGISDLFDAVVGGDMVETIKPAPDVYLMTLRQLGVPAEEAVAFEDSPFGIEAAQAAGIYTFGYRGGPIPLDTSGADEQIDTFEGFAL